MRNTNVEELVVDYVENNITENIKEEFLNAAIHFIVNENLCDSVKFRMKK